MRAKIVITLFSMLLVASIVANVFLFWMFRLSEDVVESQMMIVQIVESLLKDPPSDLSKSEVLKRAETIYPRAKKEVGADFIIVANAKLYFKEGRYWGSSYDLK